MLKYKREDRRHGVVATELALTLPVMILLLLGSVDFARAGFQAIALANATGAAGHFGATNRRTPLGASHWDNELRRIVEEELAGNVGFNEDDLTVSASTLTEVSGIERVSVQATYTFRTIVNWPWIPNSINLSQTVVFHQYR